MKLRKKIAAILLIVLAGCANEPEGGIDALALGPTIVVTDIVITDNIDVTGATGLINCDVDITSTNDIMDVSCEFISPSGTVRGCTSSAFFAGNQKIGTWVCNAKLEADQEVGDWKINYVSARDVITPQTKYSGSHDDLLADAGNLPSVIDANDLKCVVASTNEDKDGPAFVSATSTPTEYIFDVLGETFICTNTLTDATAVLESGCSLTSPADVAGVPSKSCIDSVGSGGVWSCSIEFPSGAGAATGMWHVHPFARDTLGNRSTLLNNDAFDYQYTGLEFTDCDGTYVQAVEGSPLAIDIDSDGNAYSLGEWNTVLMFLDRKDGGCTKTNYVIPHFSASVKPFWYNGQSSQVSVFGEGVVWDPIGDIVWASQGGDSLQQTETNHSRIVSFDKDTTTWKGYNLPGNRNESQGLWWDETRGLLWVAEAGFFTSYGTGVEGHIVAFDPDITAEDINYQWPNPQDTALDVWLCGVGETPVGNADDCYDRYILPTSSTAPAHLVGDPSGMLWYTAYWGNEIGRLDPAGEGTVTVIPLGEHRCYNSNPLHPCSLLGGGPWEIKMSPDNLYVVFNEFFDNEISRFPIARWSDSVCSSLTFDDISSTGLVARYTFDSGTTECGGTITDDSGNGHTGTCTSGTEPAFVADYRGPGNDVYQFDGVDDLINLGTAVAFDIAGDFTVALWMKAAATQVTNAAAFTKGNGTYGLRREGTSNIGFTMYPGPTHQASSFDVFRETAWHHVAGVFDDTANTMTIYVDGVQTGQTTQSSVTINNGLALTIGGNIDDAAADFKGWLDDVRLYSRTLTSAELITLGTPGYNSCMEVIQIPLDMVNEKTHTIGYHPNDTLWFATAITSGLASGIAYATLGFIDSAWTRATLIDPSLVNPDPNPAGDKGYAGMVINQNNSEIWLNSGPGPVDNNRGVGVYRTLPPEGIAVRSVNRYTVTLVDTDLIETIDLGSIDTISSVPFATVRVVTPAVSPELQRNYVVDVYFSGGNLIVERAVADGEIVVEVSVVEFYSSRVFIQSGTWSMTAVQTQKTEVLSDHAVLPTKAFALAYGMQNAATGSWSNFEIRHQLTGCIGACPNITMTRDSTTGAGVYSGHYFVVESLGDEFTVQSIVTNIINASFSRVLVSPGAFTSVDSPTSFFIGSYSSASNSTINTNNTIDSSALLDPISFISLSRLGSVGILNYQGYLVTLGEGYGTVQKGTFSNVGASSTVALSTAVDVAKTDSMVMVQGSSTPGTGSEGGTQPADVPEAYFALDIINSGTDVRIQHSDGAGDATSNGVSWQVITWNLP